MKPIDAWNNTTDALNSIFSFAIYDKEIIYSRMFTAGKEKPNCEGWANYYESQIMPYFLEVGLHTS